MPSSRGLALPPPTFSLKSSSLSGVSEMTYILIVGVVTRVSNIWQNSLNPILQICRYKLYLNKKRAWGENQWALGSEPVAGHGLNLVTFIFIVLLPSLLFMEVTPIFHLW